MAILLLVRPNNNTEEALNRVRIYSFATPGGNGTVATTATTQSAISNLYLEKKRLSALKTPNPAEQAMLLSVEKRLKMWREIADHEIRMDFRADRPDFNPESLRARVDFLKEQISLEKNRIESSQ
ncbi:MAG: hypothetical protein R3C61_21545 [Bacteroidia bacterium]